MEIEELIKEYSDELYSKMPIFFKYLEVINAYAGYFGQIEGHMADKVKDIEDYKGDVDYISLVGLCNEILSSLDVGLCAKFNQRLVDGTVNLDEEEETITSMSVKAGKIDITINKTYTIEDVLGIIHEFFHSIHIEKFDNDLQNPDWYFFTEAVAMIGEIYAIMYMYNHNIMREDLISYIKKYLSTIFAQADTTLLTGLTLEIYDKEQSLSDDAVNHFIQIKQLPEEYSEIIDVLEYLDDFLFHESATYTFGFPISMIVATKMIEDENYKRKVIQILSNINDYSLESLLTILGIEDILKNEDYICLAMNYVYEVSDKLVEEQQIDIKRLLVEMR